MPIRFLYERIDFKLENPRKTARWIIGAAEHEGRSVKEINFIFCRDRYLLKLNQEFLSHDTLTDIITFDYSEKKEISGEIFISVDRVKDNSSIFGTSFRDEIRRVMIHGILHLSGYQDKKSLDAAQMRKKEEAYLSLWKRMFHVKRSR